jgi:hypothetical protein
MSSNNYFKFSLTALALAATVAFAPTSSAALATYTQNFEGMTPEQGFSDPDSVPPFVNDLAADGWKVFGVEWDANPYPDPSSANIEVGYGPFEAGNGEPASFQGVATEESGAAQGLVVLNKYSDYNNPNQPTKYIEGLTFQEQTIAAGDVGLWRLTYDAKIGNLIAESSAYAFIKTLDSTTFDQKALVSNDSTNLPDTWDTYSIDLLIDGTLVGDILQFGFSATSTNFNGSAVFYDNLVFAPVSTVPVPAAVWLFGSGLVGLVGVARRRKH